MSREEKAKKLCDSDLALQDIPRSMSITLTGCNRTVKVRTLSGVQLKTLQCYVNILKHSIDVLMILGDFESITRLISTANACINMYHPNDCTDCESKTGEADR